MACALTGVRAVAGSPLLQCMTMHAQQPLPDWTLLAVFLAQLAAHHGAPVPTVTPTADAAAADSATRGCERSGLAAEAAHAWREYLRILPGSTGNVLEWPEHVVTGMDSSSAGPLARDICRAADEAWLQVPPPAAPFMIMYYHTSAITQVVPPRMHTCKGVHLPAATLAHSMHSSD